MVQDSSIATVAANVRELAARAQPGDRLPSSRELVRRWGVSPVTVSRALALLGAEGAIEARPGSGTFAARPMMPITAQARDYAWQSLPLGSHTVDDSGLRSLVKETPPDGIWLGCGYPHPSLTAASPLAAAMARAGRRPGAWERPALSGLPPLRQWFADSIGAGFGVDDVLITSGGQAALSVAMRATSPAGSAVLVESPTYPGALAVAGAAGLVATPVPIDGGGLRADLLEEAFARTGARLVYCQPTFQNPGGSVMDARRRADVLAVVRAAGAFLIEDDWARWLAHDGAPPPPMIAGDPDGCVIHVSSLTKTAAPGLRIGALTARGPVAERLRALRLVDSLFVSGPLQETALDLVSSATWTRHLVSLRRALRVRQQALLAALGAHLPGLGLGPAPRGGFYLWGRLPKGSDDVAVAAAAAAAGVTVAAGRSFFAAEPPGAFLRLSFAGPASVDEIDEGVRRVASVLERG